MKVKDMKKKNNSKSVETKKSSIAKAMKAQGMPDAGPVDLSDSVVGEEAEAYFGPVSDMYPSKKKSKRYKLKKKKTETSEDVDMPSY